MNIRVVRGDITTLFVDAIVNAANNSLMGGGGVDGAIHRAGGPSILKECKKIVAVQGECKTGEAVITTAGDMPSRYVIHTVGPVWYGGHRNEETLLRNAYVNSLKLAVQYGLNSVAFPNISTGIYQFPKDKASLIAVTAVKEFLRPDLSIREVFFVCHDEENFRLYSILLR